MEATLPRSAVPEVKRPRPALASAGASIASNLGPSMALPMHFVMAGLLALSLGLIWLIFRPEVLATYHYTQYAVAITHLFTLGWITTLIMGAMYQLVPVALEARLYSERLAHWQFLCHVAGVAGMVWSFWVWNMKVVGHYGSLVGLGMILFSYNIARTVARTPRWNVVSVTIVNALFWLLITMLSGLYLAADKCWNFNKFFVMAQIHAHAHLGAVGLFLTLIIGVSYKLVPMFTLSDLQCPRRAAGSLVLLNAGLITTFFTILYQSRWRWIGAVLLSAALALYGWEMLAIVRARKRRHLDWGLRYFLTALGLLAPLSILGLVLVWPGLPATLLTTQLENVYGFLGLLGVVTLAILGMSYKIIPFLVWYHSYSRLIGRCKVPALGDMYSARLQKIGYWTYLAGLTATCIAAALGHETATRWSCLVLVASLAIYALNIGYILRHYWQPKTEPLVLTSLKNSPLCQNQ